MKVTHSVSHTPWSCQGAVLGWGLVPAGVWCSSCLPSVCTDSLTCHPMLCWADSESDEGEKKESVKQTSEYYIKLRNIGDRGIKGKINN